MTADMLRAAIMAAHQRVKTAEADLAAAHQARAARILDATREDVPVTTIARDTGLTRDAIYKIAARYR
jgi:DNA-binding phage protein